MEKIWLEAQSNIKKVLTPQTYNTWIKPIHFHNVSDTNLTLEVPSKFIKEWVTEKYLSIIIEAISSLTNIKYQVDFKITEKSQVEKKKVDLQTTDKIENDSTRNVDFNTNLNPKYTFDSFVCGASNQFAHAASQAVANNPACNYNPLFIYGGVGSARPIFSLQSAIRSGKTIKKRKFAITHLKNS